MMSGPSRSSAPTSPTRRASRLSHASPVGRAVLKRQVGDKAPSPPRGATEYEIVNVEVAS